MTATNRKMEAKEVDVFPVGRVFRTEGNYSLIETVKNQSTWYKLSRQPDEIQCQTFLPKGATIVRREEDDVFLYRNGETVHWVKVVQSQDLSKTMFQVEKIQHEVLIINPKAIFIRYHRDKSTEWVQNVTTPARKVMVHGEFATA